MSSAVDLPRSGALGRASDAQLTRLIRQGNQEAFAELYERHNSLVMAVARASSRERAEDIAQEAWTSAYRALSGPGKSIEHAAPWLATIARNVARDRARRDMRLPEVTNDDIVAAAPAVGGVESALEGKHNLGRLLGAFDELSEEQRVILSLREFGGLTYKQIAEQLGKPESTIEAALFRARRKMAKEYAELDSGRRCRIVQSQLLTGRQLSHVERLRISRHLGRCVTCERVARLEGADDLIPTPRLARIAGVIPVPGFLARLLAGGADAVSPLAGKAAVAAVTIVVGTGALVVTQGATARSPRRARQDRARRQQPPPAALRSDRSLRGSEHRPDAPRRPRGEAHLRRRIGALDRHRDAGRERRTDRTGHGQRRTAAVGELVAGAQRAAHDHARAPGPGGTRPAGTGRRHAHPGTGRPGPCRGRARPGRRDACARSLRAGGCEHGNPGDPRARPGSREDRRAERHADARLPRRVLSDQPLDPDLRPAGSSKGGNPRRRTCKAYPRWSCAASRRTPRSG